MTTAYNIIVVYEETGWAIINCLSVCLLACMYHTPLLIEEVCMGVTYAYHTINVCQNI